MAKIKDAFLLDRKVIFLNHGSFGACPRPVFEAYQAWQRRLEAQPVLFLGRELIELQRQARQALGIYLHAAPDDLVFAPNATYGVNIVARSLALKPGDEILTSDHEYGACDNTWNFLCHKSGASYVRQSIPLPIQSPEVFFERFWQGVTPRTKLIYLSHITSPTAQYFPIEAICQQARQAGILTLVDGAHAPGQIPLDLEALGADFYTGNCHKWMLSPKGAGFLYARREAQSLVEPLVVSWGYSADEKTTSGSRYIDLLQWSGTHEPAAALSVPAAIQFMQEHDWDEVRQGCHQLLRQALQRIEALTGLPSAYPENQELTPLPPQMGVARLPRQRDLAAVKARLYDEYRIEVPLVEWNEEHFMRISIQGYNSRSDVDALVQALAQILPSQTG
ncbi:MAG: aminotransferase class V-fold PLP-dependent enzyme [Chloroflexota bacterium]